MKKLLQLIWIGSSGGGMAGLPGIISRVGKGEQTVTLSQLGLKSLEGTTNGNGEKGICVVQGEDGKPKKIYLQGDTSGWWELEGGGGELEANGDGCREQNESTTENVTSRSKEINKKHKECYAQFEKKTKTLMQLRECLKEILKSYDWAVKQLKNREQQKKHFFIKDYGIPTSLIVQAGKGWTWHKKK